MQLFFREEGKSNSQTIVIVHGLYGSSDNWLTVGKKLGLNYHVYLIDQRNHGRSPNADSHTYENMTEDLAAFLKSTKLKRQPLLATAWEVKRPCSLRQNIRRRLKN